MEMVQPSLTKILATEKIKQKLVHATQQPNVRKHCCLKTLTTNAALCHIPAAVLLIIQVGFCGQ